MRAARCVKHRELHVFTCVSTSSEGVPMASSTNTARGLSIVGLTLGIAACASPDAVEAKASAHSSLAEAKAVATDSVTGAPASYVCTVYDSSVPWLGWNT